MLSITSLLCIGYTVANYEEKLQIKDDPLRRFQKIIPVNSIKPIASV